MMDKGGDWETLASLIGLAGVVIGAIIGGGAQILNDLLGHRRERRAARAAFIREAGLRLLRATTAVVSTTVTAHRYLEVKLNQPFAPLLGEDLEHRVDQDHEARVIAVAELMNCLTLCRATPDPSFVALCESVVDAALTLVPDNVNDALDALGRKQHELARYLAENPVH